MSGRHDRASESLAAPSVVQPPLAGSSVTLAPESAVAGDPAAHDPLSDVLRMVKLTGALFFLVDASSPWALEVPRARVFASFILPGARHVISYHIVMQGSGWISVSGDPPIGFAAGDILVFPHEHSYAMRSAPEPRSETNATDALDFFRAMAAGELPFVVTEGGGGPERARLVCGFLGCDARPFNPLLATLPRFMHVQRLAGVQNDLLDRLIDLTLAEAPMRRAGGECIRLRLSELMFVEVVRRYLEALPADQTGWLAGLRDPAIGRVLALLHERPAHAWTLEELARQVGMSRSVLADRFTHLVGRPPMQYLIHWRVQVAARLLADGATKVATVGQEVGYASEAAFSRTFKKIAGVSPATWRERCATP
ncbi:MAG: AraC family transcriptional regulator [Xanthobacteraceae bacterium]